MEVTLDGVARVVEHEDDGLDANLLHDGQLLNGELEGTVTDEEDGTGHAEIAGSECASEGGADGPSDGTPEDLGNEDGALWEGEERVDVVAPDEDGDRE